MKPGDPVTAEAVAALLAPRRFALASPEGRAALVAQWDEILLGGNGAAFLAVRMKAAGIPLPQQWDAQRLLTGRRF